MSGVDPNASTARERFITSIDDTYDESNDPDYTLSNATIINDDDDDDDDEYNSDSVSDLESDLEVKTNGKVSIPQSTSSVELPIHKKFYTLIHKHEIPRKLFHVSIGFITIYLHLNHYKTKDVIYPVSVAVTIISLIDLIRLNNKYFNKLYCSTVGFLMRDSEINSINGVIWFQLGSLITFYFNKQDVSIMAILLLSWSDTAASTVGRRFGYLSPKISKNKSLVGSIAAFFVGIFSCYLFYGIITPLYPSIIDNFEYDPNTNHISLLTLSLLSGFIASLSEGIEIFNLDDNLTIPVLSSLFLSFVIKLGK